MRVMKNLEDVVSEVVTELVNKDESFTALDVSNQVKTVLPMARHRAVRDEVRSLFNSFMITANYTQSTITVKTKDNDDVSAILYHNLNDSWNLNTKYPQSRRDQSVASVPVASTLAAAVPVVVAPVVAPAVVKPAVVQAPAPKPVLSAKNLWDSLFNSQPSLFPRKQ